MAEVYQRVTRYEVNVFPDEMVDKPYSEAFHWTVVVEYRGRGKWAVLHFGFALGADGEWDYEPSSSNREDSWLETHRFDLETALRLAGEQAPKITVNGLTALDYLARHASAAS